MECNKLSIKIEKNNYLIFKSKQKKISNDTSHFLDSHLLKQ